MQRLKLDINPKGEIPVLYVSQYDNGRLFQIELVDGEDAYDLPEEYSMQLNVRKTDSKLVTAAPETIVDNVLTFATTEQMTACPGENIASVTLKDADDHVITTLYFLISVQRDVLAGGLNSASEIHNLEQQISAIVPEVIGDDYYNKTETDALLADKANRSELGELSSKAELEHAINEEDALLKDWAFSQFTTPGYIASRYYNKSQVDELLFNMMPIDTESGNPCSFNTEIATVLQALSAEIVASGGGGTPDNPIPIVGHSELNLTRCGINQWDEEWEEGGINSQGQNITIGNRIRSKNYIHCKPSTTYYFNIPIDKGLYRVYYNKNKEVISAGWWNGDTAYTTPADCYYIRFTTGDLYGSTYNNDLSINYPSTDHAYHAYNGQTFTVAFGQTVYGGTYDKSGRLTITHIGITRTWEDFGNKTALTNYTRGSLNISSEGKGVDNNTTDICNIATYQYSWSSDTNHFYIQISGDSTYLYVFLPNDTSDDTEIQVCYELATPIVIDVTAISPSAVVGTNNIISDCNGNVNVSYKDSIQHYIDTRG